ncbi:TPA: ABC transporter permease [Aeromonas sobria]|nr:ABC transporter permease [Aeromonas sobria]
MNKREFTSPQSLIYAIYKNRKLIYSLTKRDVLGRYQGSIFGILWSFFTPVFMLGVYTFVFSLIFNARWSSESTSKTEFALVLFAGLIVFNFFSECANKAPTLILSNSNYVKKVIFPLEILPVNSALSALFHAMISLSVWFSFFLIQGGEVQVTWFLTPIVLFPVFILSMGIGWLLSSLGVYLRDVGQFVSILVTTLMFLSPIFYPITAIPVEYRYLLHINPLATAIEQVRAVLYFGITPNLDEYIIYLVACLVFAWLCFVVFQKTKKGFSDVL